MFIFKELHTLKFKTNYSMPMRYLFFILSFIYAEPIDSKVENFNLNLEEEIAREVYKKTNTLRSEKGLSVFVQTEDMNILSKLHTHNMIKHNFFDHKDHENASPSDRADALDFGWTGIAENIGRVPWFENVTNCGDTRSAKTIVNCMMKGWENSPGHYANLVGDFQQIGIGVEFTKDSIVYFTQVFRNP